MAKNSKKERGKVGRPKGTGSRRVYEALRTRILTLQMNPGAVIDENPLVSEFGVSRTPVREALIGLAKDGYVSLLPNRGATVTPLDIEEIPELLESLELCFRVTTRWAALRRTKEDIVEIRRHHQAWHEAARRDDYPAMSESNNAFHHAIARSAGNRHVTKFYENMLPQYYRLSLSLLVKARFTWKKYKDYFEEVNDDHERLVRSIEDQDPELADRLAQRHAKLIGERVVAYLKNFSEAEFSIGNPSQVKIRTELSNRRSSPAKRQATTKIASKR